MPPSALADTVGHLTALHQNYFLEWSKMLRLEEEESKTRSRSISDIWSFDPLDREAQGTCLSHLQVSLQDSLFFFANSDVNW